MGKKKMLMRKFGSVAIVNNTFIGGVASVINTPALLAEQMRNYPSFTVFDVNNIKSFTIKGNDIECYIDVDYASGNWPITTGITYFHDLDGKVKQIGAQIQGFYNSNSLKSVIAPNCVRIGNGSFDANLGGEYNLEFLYTPRCTSIAETLGDDSAFRSGHNGSLTMYVDASMQTINGGGIEGDLQGLIDRGNDVIFVTNFTKPQTTTDLAANTVYAAAIELDWSVPTSTNAIDYYEVYVDGVFYENTSINEILIRSLTNLQTYNFSIIAVDIFYNKSEMSNVVTQQINGVDPVFSDPSSIISYYQYENNVLDSVGMNNGIATDITYASGLVGNAAIFNGGTSKVVIPSGNSLSFTNGTNDLPFSINMLVNLNSTSNQMLINKLVSGSREYYIFYINQKIRFYLDGGDGSNNIYVETLNTISFSVLKNLTLVYDGSELNTGLNIYIDGELEQVNRFSTGAYVGMTDFNTELVIGKHGNPSTSDLYVDGSIDEISIFNKELSQTEVTEIDALLMAGFSLI